MGRYVHASDQALWYFQYKYKVLPLRNECVDPLVHASDHGMVSALSLLRHCGPFGLKSKLVTRCRKWLCRGVATTQAGHPSTRSLTEIVWRLGAIQKQQQETIVPIAIVLLRKCTLFLPLLFFIQSYSNPSEIKRTMSSVASMYLRIKRRNQTFFIMCEPNHTIQYLKEQISLATKQEFQPSQMRLLLPKDDSVLNDDEKLEKIEIKSEAELYLVLNVSDNEWEPVDVVGDPTVADNS
eukprot:scaffold3924_cov109-Cylindrotheca_fusiformis.AAC.2